VRFLSAVANAPGTVIERSRRVFPLLHL
jgi:hypothetical protein